jgi:hypothetical protein
MSALDPLEALYELPQGAELPLPPPLLSLYGRLWFPAHPGHLYVIGNVVTTLDGVVSLNVPGQSGGGPISGFNAHDRMVMGVLRAAADAVIVGAGTLRAVSPGAGQKRTAAPTGSTWSALRPLSDGLPAQHRLSVAPRGAQRAAGYRADPSGD